MKNMQAKVSYPFPIVQVIKLEHISLDKRSLITAYINLKVYMIQEMRFIIVHIYKQHKLTS